MYLHSWIKDYCLLLRNYRITFFFFFLISWNVAFLFLPRETLTSRFFCGEFIDGKCFARTTGIIQFSFRVLPLTHFCAILSFILLRWAAVHVPKAQKCWILGKLGAALRLNSVNVTLSMALASRGRIFLRVCFNSFG